MGLVLELAPLFIKRDIESAALDAVLEMLPAPALLVDSTGGAVRTNSAAKQLPQAALRELPTALRAFQRDDFEEAAGWTFRRVDMNHPLIYYVAVRPTVQPTTRMEAAIAAWGLTPRQAEVFALLLEGMHNRGIAARLDLAAGTVELHVTAVLRRARASSRSELLARFWTEVWS
jgi:DNA-binding CsgD family transcriptional regulator